MERPPLRIGQVLRARGLRGEVAVRLDNEGSALLTPGRRLLVTPAAPRGGADERPPAPGPARWLVVAAARPLNKGWGVTFEGVRDRTAAEGLHGAAIAVAWDALPALEADEFYYEQVRGYAVVLPDGSAVGTVVGVFETNVDMLVVTGEGGREHLIPVVDEIVRSIDHAARRIEIDPPDGLLELAGER